MAHYKANYNPHKPASPPQTHQVQGPRQDEPFEHLQREYLDTAHSESDNMHAAETGTHTAPVLTTSITIFHVQGIHWLLIHLLSPILPTYNIPPKKGSWRI